MKKRNVLDTPRLRAMKKKKRQESGKKALLVLPLILFLLGALVYLSRWERINIHTVEVSGINAADEGIVKEMVEEKMSGYYLFFVPKTNFLLFPKKSIERELSSSFKRFTDIEMDVVGATRLDISLSEREARYLWCGESIPVGKDPSNCYFMDETGYVFEEAPYFSGDVYFKFFGEIEDESPLGSFFLPGLFEKVDSLRKTIEYMDIEVVSFSSLKNQDMEFVLASNSSPAPVIKFRFNADFEKLSENLETALSTEPLSGEFKEKYNKLEYIDLRFGNKVYYRFK